MFQERNAAFEVSTAFLADSKQACSLSEDLELLPECEEETEKGWSRTALVDSSVGV